MLKSTCLQHYSKWLQDYLKPANACKCVCVSVCMYILFIRMPGVMVLGLSNDKSVPRQETVQHHLLSFICLKMIL